MPMSDREQRILEELEDEFRPAPQAAVLSQWSAIGTTKRLVSASIAALAGLSLLGVGVVLADAAGVAVSVVAYALVVGSVHVIVSSTSERRATRRLVRADRRARSFRFLW